MTPDSLELLRRIGIGIPLLERGGGRDVKRNGAKPPLTERTGWSLTRNLTCERPPRLREFRWLRGIFLLAQPPLLTRRGMFLVVTLFTTFATHAHAQARG